MKIIGIAVKLEDDSNSEMINVGERGYTKIESLNNVFWAYREGFAHGYPVHRVTYIKVDLEGEEL